MGKATGDVNSEHIDICVRGMEAHTDTHVIHQTAIICVKKVGAAGFSYNVFDVEAKHQRAGRVVSGLFDMGATSIKDSFNLNRLSFVSARDLDSSDRQSAFV